MGNRRNIQLTYKDRNKIYFYTHWGADELENVIKKVLRRKERWDDESYLARMIFSEMIKDKISEETGYGIAPYEIDSENPTIELDLGNQTVNKIPFEEYIKF